MKWFIIIIIDLLLVEEQGIVVTSQISPGFCANRSTVTTTITTAEAATERGRLNEIITKRYEF